jgi:hypothetical protein
LGGDDPGDRLMPGSGLGRDHFRGACTRSKYEAKSAKADATERGHAQPSAAQLPTLTAPARADPSAWRSQPGGVRGIRACDSPRAAARVSARRARACRAVRARLRRAAGGILCARPPRLTRRLVDVRSRSLARVDPVSSSLPGPAAEDEQAPTCRLLTRRRTRNYATLTSPTIS